MRQNAKSYLPSAPIAITTGDHRGIGAEIISKGLHKLSRENVCDHVVVMGDPKLYLPYRKLLTRPWRLWQESDLSSCTGLPPKGGWKPTPGAINFVLPSIPPKAARARDAYLSGRYVDLAARGCLSGLFSGLCTGPISKQELHRGGYPFDGHTELLHHIAQVPSVTMMLASPSLRVSLATVHVPITQIAQTLSRKTIVTCIENTARGLSSLWKIQKPRLAVLGLNPHAGDGGLFGSEEKQVIVPAIRSARSRIPNCTIEGPFAADGFFAQWRTRHTHAFDAVIAMYHDQGLIPAKMADFDNTVNISLGLPFIRTSVDHGVAYDISGKNLANPASFIAALRLAIASTRRPQK